MPTPLVRIQCCYTLQPGPRWGTNAHLRLCPVHKRQALGLPRFALVPGLAVFHTNPSLDWVSPVALAENMVRAMQYLFFSLDFSSILPLDCTLGFYPPSGPPHCDLTMCLPSVRSIAAPFLINPYNSAHVPHMRPELSCHQ